jgi:hypothetical protein
MTTPMRPKPSMIETLLDAFEVAPRLRVEAVPGRDLVRMVRRDQATDRVTSRS